jgi:amidase
MATNPINRLLAIALAVAFAHAYAESDFRLVEADVAAIHEAYRAGSLSAEELTRAYLERIARYDRQGPALNAFISVNPDALERARALDRERARHGIRGALHGIPIVVKDNYDTHDLPTTGGSAVLADHRPDADAFTVARLRAAGAIVVGKTNLSELALSYGRLSYSSAGGLTLNPYNPRRNASGSSSGTGAAVAANLAVLGTGTDTAGSIRAPAAVTGTVGIKPTLGLTSRAGVIPASLSLDVTGPIARSVRDAAIVLAVMAAEDPADARTLVSDASRAADYLDHLDPDALNGKRLGVVTNYSGGNREVDAAFRRALDVLERRGATVVDVRVPDLIANAWSTMMGPVVDNEFGPQLERYFRDSRAPVLTLDALIEGSLSPEIANSDRPVNPARVEGYRQARASLGVADLEYLTILSRRMPRARALVAELMETEHLHALVFPTMLCPASPRFDREDDSYRCDAEDPYTPSYMASSTGFPEISVPMGYTRRGLPLGISFFATAWREPDLIGLAYDYEQATGWRKPPPAATSNGDRQ